MITNNYHHGNLRSDLIKAALSLIMKKGASALTIREVARRAGVSHTAPYRHFKDKNELLAMVAKEGFDLMVLQMKKRVAAFPDDPLMRFKYCGFAYIEFAVSHPAHYRVMFGQSNVEPHESEELQKSATASFQTLLDCIADCQSHGSIRPGDPMAMALSAWSIVHGFAMLFIDRHVKEAGIYNQKLENMMDVVTDSLYFGLRPEEPL